MSLVNRGAGLIPPEPEMVRNILAPRSMTVVRDADKSLLAADVIVGITVHNNGHTLARCLESVLDQQMGPWRLAVVVLDDSSVDGWMDEASGLLDRADALVVKALCGSAAHSRNALLDFVTEACPNCRWVARLDGDDRLTDSSSLRSMCDAGARADADYILGGNRLCVDGKLIEKINPFDRGLFEDEKLLRLLEEMACGDAENELPSCNLLINPSCGWRYPSTGSAEDHWLVTTLLLQHKVQGTFCSDGFYCDYSLDGNVSRQHKSNGNRRRSRQRLYEFAYALARADSVDSELLGYGLEGLVYLHNDIVEKRFHSWVLDDEQVGWLSSLGDSCLPFLPSVQWEKTDGQWVARYPFTETEDCQQIELAEAREFLDFCLANNIVCQNIKSSNFRRRSGGELLYIDVGPSVIPMDVDRFRDMSARFFAISELGWPDDELKRRPSKRRQRSVLRETPGFVGFYQSLLEKKAQSCWALGGWASENGAMEVAPVAENVTLLIRSCPMDAHLVREQVEHIVTQLESPRKFCERVLQLDPFEGPFLRQYAEGNLERLQSEAERLVSDGFVDRVIVAPLDEEAAREVLSRWFWIDCAASHTGLGVPLVAPLWGFEQVKTRYVLQCDIDALVGRRDRNHDFLKDMLEAVGADGVFGVAFAIAQDPDGDFLPYRAEPGQFVPEVRCGLLDLDRLMGHRPYPNSVIDGKPELSWYRSVQKYQEETGMRTQRGGDRRTFYIHPPNGYKKELPVFRRIRDLVGQGNVPTTQYKNWDVVGDEDDWLYEKRGEKIVFLLRGRATALEKIRRCFASLRAQTNQDFGLIVIDDGTGARQSARFAKELKSFPSRHTLICNHERKGRIPNTILAVRDICSNSDTLIVILDQDDALMDVSVVDALHRCVKAGNDIVLGSMYRPDKPLKVYHPNFVNPSETYGGEVWIHLRAFRKKLFDRLTDSQLQHKDGQWFEECEDYATMVPMVEMAEKPVYFPRYLYYHERTTPYTDEVRVKKDEVILDLVAKKVLRI